MWCCGSFFFAILCWSQCFFGWTHCKLIGEYNECKCWKSCSLDLQLAISDGCPPPRSYRSYKVHYLKKQAYFESENLLDVDGQNPARVVDLVNYPIHCNMFQTSQLASPKCCSIYPEGEKNENGFAEVQSTLLSANGKFLPSNSDTSNSGFCGRTTSSAIA